jgi:hypothetical protein
MPARSWTAALDQVAWSSASAAAHRRSLRDDRTKGRLGAKSTSAESRRRDPLKISRKTCYLRLDTTYSESSMFDAPTCFVIGPIGEEGSPQRVEADTVLYSFIRPAITKLIPGMEVIRADEISTPGNITRQIWEHVIGADLVICDMADKNANAFYELAIRHAVGRPIVHLYPEGQDIPFDVRALRAVPYGRRNFPATLDAIAKAVRAAFSGKRPLEGELVASVQNAGPRPLRPEVAAALGLNDLSGEPTLHQAEYPFLKHVILHGEDDQEDHIAKYISLVQIMFDMSMEFVNKREWLICTEYRYVVRYRLDADLVNALDMLRVYAPTIDNNIQQPKEANIRTAPA